MVEFIKWMDVVWYTTLDWSIYTWMMEVDGNITVWHHRPYGPSLACPWIILPFPMNCYCDTSNCFLWVPIGHIGLCSGAQVLRLFPHFFYFGGCSMLILQCSFHFHRSIVEHWFFSYIIAWKQNCIGAFVHLSGLRWGPEHLPGNQVACHTFLSAVLYNLDLFVIFVIGTETITILLLWWYLFLRARLLS